MPSAIDDDSTELFRALFEHAPDSTVVVNEKGEILLVNSQTEQMFGYRRDELFKKPVEILIPERVRPKHIEHRQQYFENPQLRLIGATRELCGRRKDGTEFPIELSLSPLKTRDGTLVRASIRDVTERHEADLARRRHHQMMESILNSIDEGFIVANNAGKLLLINRAAVKLHGKDSLDVPQDVWPEHFDLFQADGIRPYPKEELPILRAMQGETLDDVELVVRAANRTTPTVIHVAARPLLEDGVVHGGIVIIRDVTEKRRIDAAWHESEARFREAFDHAPAGMYLCNLDGSWLRVNDALCQIVGRSTEELLKTHWKEMTHPDDIEPDVEKVRRLFAGEIGFYHMEKRYFHKNGSIVWVLLHAGLVRDDHGEPLYFVGHVLDINDRKRAEGSLRRIAQALARSNADLQQFASAASHDLQAPLRSVVGFCQLLEQNYEAAFDERGKKWLRLMTDDARNMEALVRGLLRFSKVQSAGGPLMRIESRAAVERALSHLRSTIEESGAEITVDELPVVVADLDQLVDVFQNLIDNAIKYCRGRRPSIHVAARQSDGSHVFTVRDNGIGIDPQFHDRIFGMFQRLHVQDDYPGSGIGLTLCKRIVERHSGKVWVRSAPGEGSEFFFSIPSEG